MTETDHELTATDHIRSLAELVIRFGANVQPGQIVALVDREGRIGPLDTVFFDTLLDENVASHIAVGQDSSSPSTAIRTSSA